MIRAALFTIGLSALALWLLLRPAPAAAPEHSDPALAPWFQGLQSPSGASCCSIADCRPVDSRVHDGHYEALMEGGAWLPIPTDKIIHPRTNPLGRAVLCSSPSQPDLIFCFAPGVEA